MNVRNTTPDSRPAKLADHWTTLELSPEDVKSLYPLNRLNEDELRKLWPHMQMIYVRANRFLYKFDAAPDETYWLIDGVLQATDPDETRITTISHSPGETVLPLPQMVPTNETAKALMDCRVLAVNRDRFNELLESQHIPLYGSAAGESTRTATEAELRAEFNELSQQRFKKPTPRPAPEPTTTDAGDLKIPKQRTSGAAPITHLSKETNRRAGQTGSPGHTGTGTGTGTTGSGPELLSVTPDLIHRGFAAFDKLSGFRGLDLAVKANCLKQAEFVRVLSGQNVIEQGDNADHWYLILNGQCVVTLVSGSRQVELNQYQFGDAFGEDALITDSPRNASVRAQTHMTLLRLRARHFRELLLPALLRSTNPQQLALATKSDPLWIDVRLPLEYNNWEIAGSIRVPWPVIRAYTYSSNNERSCIIVCRDGRRSQPIAFMLRKFGFDARYLEGGIDNVPAELLRKRMVRKRPTPGGLIQIG